MNQGGGGNVDSAASFTDGAASDRRKVTAGAAFFGVVSMSLVRLHVAGLLIFLSMCADMRGQVGKLRSTWLVCPGPYCLPNDRYRENGYGTAVAVAHARGGTVLFTAGHNLRSMDGTGKLVSLSVNGHPARLTGQWLNDRQDLATVFVPDHLFDVQSLALSVAVGERVIVAGFDYAITNKPTIRYYRGEVVKASAGEFGAVDISWPVGSSGGSVSNERGELVGVACFSASFQVNRNFRAIVLAQYPSAIFAAVPPERYERPDKPENRAGLAVDDLPAFTPLVVLSEDPPAVAPAVAPVAPPVAPVAPAVAPVAPAVAPVAPADPRIGSIQLKLDALIAAAGRADDKISPVVSTIDSMVSNPLVASAILAATGGAGMAGLKAWQVVMGIRRRRRRRKAGAGDEPAGFPGLHDRDEKEAKQLLQLGGLEGRNPLLDAFVGMSFDDLIGRDIEGGGMPGDLQKYAESLRRRVKTRVDAVTPLSTGKQSTPEWSPGE